MKIERMQHEYYTYVRTNHERIGANIKKTETSSAVSLDEDKGAQSGQGEKRQPAQKQDAPPEHVTTENLPVSDVVKVGIDIRV